MQTKGSVPAAMVVGAGGKVRSAYPVLLPATPAFNVRVAQVVARG